MEWKGGLNKKEHTAGSRQPIRRQQPHLLPTYTLVFLESNCQTAGRLKPERAFHLTQWKTGLYSGLQGRTWCHAPIPIPLFPCPLHSRPGALRILDTCCHWGPGRWLQTLHNQLRPRHFFQVFRTVTFSVRPALIMPFRLQHKPAYHAHSFSLADNRTVLVGSPSLSHLFKEHKLYKSRDINSALLTDVSQASRSTARAQEVLSN